MKHVVNSQITYITGLSHAFVSPPHLLLNFRKRYRNLGWSMSILLKFKNYLNWRKNSKIWTGIKIFQCPLKNGNKFCAKRLNQSHLCLKFLHPTDALCNILLLHSIWLIKYVYEILSIILICTFYGFINLFASFAYSLEHQKFHIWLLLQTVFGSSCSLYSYHRQNFYVLN